MIAFWEAGLPCFPGSCKNWLGTKHLGCRVARRGTHQQVAMQSKGHPKEAAANVDICSSGIPGTSKIRPALSRDWPNLHLSMVPLGTCPRVEAACLSPSPCSRGLRCLGAAALAPRLKKAWSATKGRGSATRSCLEPLEGLAFFDRFFVLEGKHA